VNDTRPHDSLEDLIRDVMVHRLFEVHVSLPGRIKSWDEATQLAQVEVCLNPTLQRPDGEETVEMQVINNVPIEFPSGGGYFISFPLAVGDPVRLTFSDFSLDKWKEKGGIVDVESLNNHHETDASAYPGMRAKPDALSGVSRTNLVIGKVDDPSMRIVIDGTHIKLSENATNFVALANLVFNEINALRSDVAAKALQFNGHTHAVSGAVTGTPAAAAVPTVMTAPPTVNEVGATKVKAE
jgi:hypothetical protein